MSLPADLQDIEDQLDAADRDARELTAGIPEGIGSWSPAPGSWSVTECLDHLAITNRAYLAAMLNPALEAREKGRLRRRPARPGWIGGWFVRSLEPPAKLRIKAPPSIHPRRALPLADALASFTAEQGQVRAYLRTQGDLDLAGIPFANPFIPGIRFSLATGLQIIATHERRHLWQAWSVRKAAEAALQ